MLSNWKNLDLAERDMKKAKDEVNEFLDKNLEIWSNLSVDIQRAKIAEYLEHLQKIDNFYIINKLLQDENVMFELLRTRIKIIRNNKKDSSQSKFQSSLMLTFYNIRLYFQRIFALEFTRWCQIWF